MNCSRQSERGRCHKTRHRAAPHPRGDPDPSGPQKHAGLTPPELRRLEGYLEAVRDNLVSVDDELALIATSVTRRGAALNEIAAAIQLRAVADARVFGTSVGDFNTRHA